MAALTRRNHYDKCVHNNPETFIRFSLYRAFSLRPRSFFHHDKLARARFISAGVLSVLIEYAIYGAETRAIWYYLQFRASVIRRRFIIIVLPYVFFVIIVTRTESAFYSISVDYKYEHEARPRFSTRAIFAGRLFPNGVRNIILRRTFFFLLSRSSFKYAE